MRPLPLLVVALLTTGCSQQAAPATSAPSSASASGASSTASQRQAALESLLARRSAAVLDREVGGWVSTQSVDAAAPSWARLAALPLSAWSYDDVLVTRGSDDQMSATAVLRYRLEGERSDSAVPVSVEVVRTADGWTVVREAAGGTARPVWDLGAAVVARGGPVTVVGVDVAASDAQELADEAASAASVVGDAWSPVPDVVVVLTRTRAQEAAGLGRPVATLDGLAAVTTAAATAPGVPAAQATSRVWIDAEGWSRLGPVSRGVVLRHELLHVVTGSASSSAVPLWLEEGAGEVLGWRGSGVPLGTAARDALARVRVDGVPARLPTDADLAGPRSREAYQAAHVACAVLVDDVGLGGLRRLYEEVAGSDGTPQALDRALRGVTGAGLDRFTRDWQVRLRALAAG